MKNPFRLTIKKLALITTIFLLSISLSAQETKEDAYNKAKAEIEETFGTFPTLFKSYPKLALPGAWDNFKQLNSPEGNIPPKYRELIQLAVASQIPCKYCVYFHSSSAKSFGATEEEVKEAIAHGAATRHWSTVLQGNEIDFETFKLEFDEMMKFMSEKSKE